MFRVLRRLICRIDGHRSVPAVSMTGPFILPDAGLAQRWRIVPIEQARGIGCPRCGRYREMEWVTLSRELTGREP